MRAMSLPDPFSSIPLHRRRRREELSLDAPRQVFVVSLWCLAVVLAALLNRETIPSLSPADFIFFTLFYSLAAFFSVRIAPGLYAGLASVGVLAATFVMGYAPAMLVGVAGVGLVIPLRLLFSRRLPGLSRHRMRSIVLEALAQSAMLTLCLPPVNWATNQVVNFLAAQPPFQGMAPDARIVEIIFVSLYLALMGVSITLWLLLIRSGSEPDGERDFRALLRDLKDFLRPRWQVLAVVGFLVFFLGPLIPPLYHLGPPRLRFLWLIPDVIMMVLLYSVNTTRLVLIQRVADLHALNAIGQALSASLEMKSLLEAIRREVSRLVDTSSFYLATYDEKTRTIFFPIAYEDDQPTQISSRRFGNGLTEYVIRTGEPLLIETNVFEQAARMGIEPVRVPHTGELKSYLGVPIWVGERVIGVLGLRNYRDEYAYSQDDLRLMETVAAQVGIALQNARLYDHSQRQAAALSSLNEVTTLLGRGLELDKLIESVCRVVVEVMGSEKAAVFLLDEESSTLRLAGSVGLSERYRELSTAIDLDSARARAVRAAETVVVEDTHTVPHLKEILDVVQAEGYRAVLEVPLRLSDKVIGTLSAYYPHPRRFEAGEIELMQTLGGQVAIAVENARLFEATLARQRELELLYEASASINASLSLQNVLRAVASSMMRALELDNWLALLPRDDEQTLDVALYMTREGEQLREGTLSHTDFVLGKLPTIREAIERQGPTTVQHREVTLSPDEARLLAECHFESCFILPMTVQGEPVGVIMAGTSHPRPEFEPTQLRLAWSLANQAAVAVQNARLFERTDIALSRRLGEIDALEQILQRMTRRLDLQAVIEHVALAAATATGSEIAEVLLLDEHSNMLRVAARRVFGEWVSAEDWPLDKGVTGQVVRTGEVILLNSVANDPHYVATFESVCSELAVPIMLDKRCLGVINLESTRPFAYRTEHVRFVTTLAEHAAIAIENVRLFEAVRRRAEELDSLRTIAIELLSSMDMRHTLRVIARAALEHTQARDVHIYLYDRESDTLTFGTSLWASGEVDREFAKPRPNGLTALTARTGERHIITNPARHPLFADQVDKEGWELPIVSVPIQQRDEVVGVFNIAFDSATAINEDILGFLDLLAAQAAVAITTTRLVEQTRTGRDRLQAILDSIHDGILMFDVQGRLVMVNPRAMYLLNIRGEEFVGQHFARIARYLDRMLATESPAFSWEIIRELAGQIRESPYRITRRSYVLTRPVRRAIEEVSLPVTGRQNELLGRLFILRDVTQREEMEAFREEMSHMLVHDLRSPLSGVLTGLQMIKDELDAPPPDLDIIRTTTEIALDSANSMLRLVEAILDVNRLEAGKMALMLKPVSLKTLAQQAFQTLESVAAGADVEVRIEAPEDLPPISVDPDQIKRVMINLLDNALRYTPEGGQIRLIIEPFETYQKVSVIDTGEGIPPEYREKIFERFVQVESTRPKRGSKGSGLGLTFCRLVVEAHGGRIWVDEGPEGGAAFHFTLPVGLTLPPDRR